MVAELVPLLQQGGAAAIGSWLASLGGSHQCHCVCETLGGNPVLALLEMQLDRCGPEKLAGRTTGWSGGSLGLAFLIGIVCGCFVTFLCRGHFVKAKGGDNSHDDGGEGDRASVQRRLRALRSP